MTTIDVGRIPLTRTNRRDPAQITKDVQQRLQEDYSDLALTVEDLASAAAVLPKVVENEEDNGLVTDHVKLCGAARKRIEALRVDEKEEPLHTGRAVDAFFKGHTARIEGMEERLSKRSGDYLRAKAAREKAERERREAEERAAARKAMEEAEAKDKAAREAAAAAAKAEQEGNLSAQLDAEEAEFVAKRATDEALQVAADAERRAAREEKRAGASSADLARSRSTSGGSLSTLADVWTSEVIDFDAVDLNALRPYLNRDAIRSALAAAVKSGVRDVAGCRIWKDQKVVIR